MATYVDLATIHNPTTGTVIPASWGDQIRENDEFLIDPPACSVYNSTVQAVTTGLTGEALTANSENFDNNSMHSTSTNTSRITFQTAGRYLVTTRVKFANGSTNRCLTQFLINGTTNIDADQRAPVGGGFSTICSTSMFYVAAASDYVEVWAFHDKGSDLDVTLLEFGATFITR